MRTSATADKGAQRPRAARSPSCAAARPTSAYGAFVARVGSEVREANRAARPTPRRSPTPSQDRRQSVAGVSLDEEMTNLIRFQRAYQASSRAMSTMDEMLDVLINRTGRVGL